MRGTRPPATKLWCITPPNPARQIFDSPPNTTNPAIRHKLYTTIDDRIAFIHGTMGFPALSALCDTLDTGYFSPFPEITAALVMQYLPYSTANAQSHLDQQHQHIWPKIQSPPPEPLPRPAPPPQKTPLRVRTNDLKNRPDLYRSNQSLPTPIHFRQHRHNHLVLL